MTAASYSFIDIAVLNGVRERFARGDVLVLLAPELETVIWANGPGAFLFNRSDIEDAMGSRSNLSVQAKRQIGSLSGFPRIGAGRTVSLRLPQGVAASMITFQAEQVRLPRGELAILLSIPALQRGLRGEERLQAAVGGFAEAGYAAALIDSDGAIAAATPGFDELGLGRTILWNLVKDVAGEYDRLVKKLVTVENGILPIGFARLLDEPALHLLVTADAPQAEEEDEVEDVAPAQPVVADHEPAIAKDDRPTETHRAHADAPETFVNAEPEPEPEDPRNLPTQPVRFVWRTDASGRFSQISPEFLAVVGADTADVIGLGFRDVAVRFDFDRDEEIAALLDRRDTWSGRTVLWPVPDHGVRIPVDLAALPVYDRDRLFEGFRGFGVARPSDAVDDRAPVEPEPESPRVEAVAYAADPFQGEAPALDLHTTFGRRTSDKVVRLDDVRPQPNGRALSPTDRQALHEIGSKLKREIGSKGEPEERQVSAKPNDIAEETQLLDAGTAGAEFPHLPDPVATPDDRRFEESDPPSLSVEFEPEPARANIHFLPSAFARDAGQAYDADDRFLAHLPVATLIHSGERLHFANQAFFDLTQYESLDAFTEAGGLEALFERAPEAVAEGGLMLKRAYGCEIPVSAHLHAVPWRRAKALMLTLLPQPVIVESLPAQKTEATNDDSNELRARLAEFQTIVDTATDGVILIDGAFQIRSISQPAEALFGFDSQAIEGRPFRELFAIESQRTAQDYVERIARNGVASVMNDGREVIGREADGGFIPLFMTIGRLPNDSGYCAVLRDITNWKRAEEDLTQARTRAERASSHKSDFLARISHEIRTPLNAIIGFSELIINESFGPIGTERYRDYLRDISRSGNHVLDLVNDLLDISKIEAGEQEMNYESVSLNEVLSEAVAMMQPQANRERVIIRSSFASRLPDIVADPRSIRQIALNLLSNAVRYTPAGGQVILSTALEPNGAVVIRVRDTGIGMSGPEIDQALKPFKRVNVLKRSHREGTGLGLPLTKALVEANRARFAISSEPNEGTLVEIEFPATRVLAD